MFGKLQLKFVLICMLIGGAILFSTLFITYIVPQNASQRLAEEAMEKAISNALQDNEQTATPSGNVLILLINANKDSLTYDETKEIARAVASADESTTEVKVNGRFYMFRRAKLTDASPVYDVLAVYDYTAEHTTLNYLIFTMTLLFILGLLCIALISGLFSSYAIKPVKEAFYKQRELVANASHELKTPLTIISTDLALLQNDMPLNSEDNAKWLSGANDQIERMNKLILDMLTLSRLESENSQTIKEDIDFSQAAMGATLSFEAVCYDKNINMVCDIQPNLHVFGNRGNVEKLLGILLDNALKYTEREGAIQVAAVRRKRDVVLEITNSGEGIPEDKVNKIFDRFYRLDESHAESGKSFGLGLSLAKSIAEGLGGSILCRSEQGVSTTFEVTLPLKTN